MTTTHRRADHVRGAHPRGRRGHVRHPRRRDHAVLPRDVGVPRPAAPRALPPRAGRGARRRGLCARHRPRRASASAPAAPARPISSRRSPTPGWTARRWSRSPGRCRAPCSARTRFRRPTSPASRCRSPSTTIWSSDARGSAVRLPRGVSPRVERAPRPRAHRHHQGRAAGAHRPELGRDARPAGLQADLPRQPRQIREAIRLLTEAQQAADHGGQRRDSWPGRRAELRALAERTGIPVITTLHGMGAFPEDHPLSLGMPGMHGWVHVNRAIQECDVLFNIGGRFDDRVTGKASTFAPNAADHPRRHRPVGDRQERAGRTCRSSATPGWCCRRCSKSCPSATRCAWLAEHPRTAGRSTSTSSPTCDRPDTHAS